MISISLAILPLLFFLLLAIDRGAADPTLAANLLLPKPLDPPKPDCSSTCNLMVLPDKSGISSFTKLCGAAVPDESCTRFGQLETTVRVSGSGTQDILVKCLCSPNGHGLEISRSEAPVEATTTYIPTEMPPSPSEPAQTVALSTLETSTDTIPNGTTSSVKPDTNISLSPAAAAGISVASLVAFLILVGVCLSTWRRHIKRTEKEPDFENVWDGQQFPRNIRTLGEWFRYTR